MFLSLFLFLLLSHRSFYLWASPSLHLSLSIRTSICTNKQGEESRNLHSHPVRPNWLHTQTHGPLLHLFTPPPAAAARGNTGGYCRMPARQTRARTYIYVYTVVDTCTHIHTHTHILNITHIHAHTHAHACKRTHTLPTWLPFPLLNEDMPKPGLTK